MGLDDMAPNDLANLMTVGGAALCSLLFAGMAKGFPSGKHEENTRNQQSQAQHDDETGGAGAKPKAPKPLARVTRYTYIPTGNEQDSHKPSSMSRTF